MLTRLRNSQSEHVQANSRLSGTDLRRLLWGQPPRERAETVAKLSRLNPHFTDLSVSQLTRLCAADGGAVSRARGNAGKRGPRTKTVDRLIKKYGSDVLRQALDRHTAPELPPELATEASLEPEPAAKKVCCICAKGYEGRGHYPSPLLAGPICGECNAYLTRSARMRTGRAHTIPTTQAAE